MTTTQIAEKIPATFRKEILGANMIVEAQANKHNTVMVYLATIWTDYVEPSFNMGCNLCMDKCLKNFRAIQGDLIDLERTSRLLDEL